MNSGGGRIAQIMPVTPPAFNGLADYATRICEYWPVGCTRWVLAGLRVSDGLNPSLGDTDCIAFSKSRGSLTGVLESSNVSTAILHYVPHAYNAKGIPMWLGPELERWKALGGKRLITVFHEIVSGGGKLGRLYRPISAGILRRVVRCSDGWLTTTDEYRRLLLEFGNADPHKGIVKSVGPNVIPTRTAPYRPLGSDPLKIVVFGLSATRSRALRAHSALLAWLHERNLIARICLLGVSPSRGDNLEVTQILRSLGLDRISVTEFDAPPEHISNILIEYDLGLCYTPPENLGRSGVYAAYAAHGMPIALPGDIFSQIRARGPSSVTSWQDITTLLARMIETP